MTRVSGFRAESWLAEDGTTWRLRRRFTLRMRQIHGYGRGEGYGGVRVTPLHACLCICTCEAGLNTCTILPHIHSYVGPTLNRYNRMISRAHACVYGSIWLTCARAPRCPPAPTDLADRDLVPARAAGWQPGTARAPALLGYVRIVAALLCWAPARHPLPSGVLVSFSAADPSDTLPRSLTAALLPFPTRYAVRLCRRRRSRRQRGGEAGTGGTRGRGCGARRTPLCHTEPGRSAATYAHGRRDCAPQAQRSIEFRCALFYDHPPHGSMRMV